MATDAEALLLKAADGSKSRNFAFIFPLASGHVNPSLPVARRLVQLGHRVRYLCFEQFREAIEDTGASFRSALEVEKPLYEGRTPDAFGAINSLMAEYGISNHTVGMFMLRPIMHELQLPGVLGFLREMGADAVVCCPLFNWEAGLAAKVLGIPAIGVFTLAGPGSLLPMIKDGLKATDFTFEDLNRMADESEPAQRAVERLHAQWGLTVKAGMPQPWGLIESISACALNLVTTSEELQDPASPELLEAYQAAGTDFQYVGPLLDEAGACRAGGHRADHQAEVPSVSDAELLDRVRAARKAGRPVVLVSMGTVVTSDLPTLGWATRLLGKDGQPRGLTGCQLCRAAWAGSFDAFAAERAEDGPLIIVSLGPQDDPLGEVVPPPNAVCVPFFPQVDILKEGVKLFLTHGGQNSFMESLATSTPIVVCPAFGDQVFNGDKAVALGVGLKVSRPDPDPGCEEEAAAAYRKEVSRAMTEVFSNDAFSTAVRGCAERLARAGGVERAVQLVLELVGGTGQQQQQPQQQAPAPAAAAAAAADKKEVPLPEEQPERWPTHAGA